jgi:predicted RNA binding protein YcfA (HicA-like mRNA interferase family)
MALCRVSCTAVRLDMQADGFRILQKGSHAVEDHSTRLLVIMKRLVRKRLVSRDTDRIRLDFRRVT